jgi:hypothetical protein
MFGFKPCPAQFRFSFDSIPDLLSGPFDFILPTGQWTSVWMGCSWCRSKGSAHTKWTSILFENHENLQQISTRSGTSVVSPTGTIHFIGLPFVHAIRSCKQ